MKKAEKKRPTKNKAIVEQCWYLIGAGIEGVAIKNPANNIGTSMKGFASANDIDNDPPKQLSNGVNELDNYVALIF